ncbi:MAG: hypothetical protein C4554_08095 [Dethiobacter sp.]|nr:MAG: hypothetical protein C4554_08095 [Dethiobacter sp.]
MRNKMILKGAVVKLLQERIIQLRAWGKVYNVSIFTISTLLVLLWTTFILYQAAQPFEKQDLRPFLENVVSEERLGEMLPRVEFYYGKSRITYQKPYNFVHFFLRKKGHFIIYAVLAFLLIQQQLLYKRDAARAFALALVIVLAVAVVDEGMQYFSTGRSGMFLDVLLDISGTIPVLLWLSFRQGKLRVHAKISSQI